MAIDLVKCGRVKLHRTRTLRAKNVYHRLLVKLYKFYPEELHLPLINVFLEDFLIVE
jgi:hypothetical protein